MVKNESKKIENVKFQNEEFEEVNLEESIKDFSVLFSNMSEWYHETIKKDMKKGNSEIIRTHTIKRLIKNYETITSKYSKKEIVDKLNNSLANERIYVGKYGGKEIYSTLSEEIFSASATFARYIINKIELDNRTKNKDLITKHLEILYPFLDSKSKEQCESFLEKKLEKTFDNFKEELKDLNSIDKDFKDILDKLLSCEELLTSSNNSLNKEEVISKIEGVYEEHLAKYPGNLDEYLISKGLKYELNDVSFAIYRNIDEISRRNYQNYGYCLDLNEHFLHERLREIKKNYLNSVDSSDRLDKLQKEIEGLRNQLRQTKKEIADNQRSMTSWATNWLGGKSEQVASGLKRKVESLEKEIKKLESQLSSKLEANIIIK